MQRSNFGKTRQAEIHGLTRALTDDFMFLQIKAKVLTNFELSEEQFGKEIVDLRSAFGNLLEKVETAYSLWWEDAGNQKEEKITLHLKGFLDKITDLSQMLNEKGNEKKALQSVGDSMAHHELEEIQKLLY